MIDSNPEFRRIVREFDRMNDASAEMSAAVRSEELRTAWEEFLMRYRRGLEKLANFAARYDASAKFAKELRGRWQGGDEGVAYLWEARNADDHGAEDQYGLSSAEYNIGRAVLVDESSTVFIGKLVMDGKVVGENIRFDNGNTSGNFTPGHGFNATPAKLTLVEIYSEQKKRTFAVPRSLAGAPISIADPIDLARSAVADFAVLLSKMRRDYGS